MASSAAATCADTDDKNLDGLEFAFSETSEIVEAQAAAGARPKRAASSQQTAGTAEHLPSFEEGGGEPSPNNLFYRYDNIKFLSQQALESSSGPTAPTVFPVAWRTSTTKVGATRTTSSVGGTLGRRPTWKKCSYTTWQR